MSKNHSHENKLDLGCAPEQSETLTAALDAAWEMFLKSGSLNSKNLDTARTILAFGILDCAARGETNARRMAMSAVARYAATEAELQRARRREAYSRDAQRRHA
jgi:hypothetical protein